MQVALRFHLLYGAGHARARQPQRVAQVRHAHPPALRLQLLDGVQIPDVGGLHPVRQRRQHVPRALGQVAGIHQLLDVFNGHEELLFETKITKDNYHR